MAGPRVMRVVRLRPSSSTFDQVLRSVLLPDLIGQSGCLEVFAGRRADPSPEERIVVSIWRDRQAMVDAVGDTVEASPFHPELRDSTTDRELVVCDLEFGDRTESAAAPTVLRLVEGTVRPGELAAYVAEAEAGMVADRAAGRGPIAMFLGLRGMDSFVTLSLWPGWSTVQDATGGDVERPIATRHAERLLGWTAWHYEALTAEGRPVARRPSATDTLL